MRHCPLILVAIVFADGSQAADVSSTSETPLEAVSVTASRINRTGYEAPTPTTVLSGDALILRAPDTLANAITHLPQMRNVANQGTGSLKFGQSAGRGFANLRGLGTNRTLVLLDGQRPVSNSLAGDRDILSFPSALIKQVDVVTGGASASYGSDAIAGVVNFIIDSEFTGFRTSMEVGTSEHSDASTRKFTTAWGTDLSDRWRLIASTEFFDRDGLFAESRSFASPSAIVANPDFGYGERPMHVVRNAYDADQSPGGLILNGPLAGQQFLGDGSIGTYAPVSCDISQPYLLCDSRRKDLASTLSTVALTSPQRRLAGFARLNFEPSSTLDAHFDAQLSRTETAITSLPLETSEFGLQLPINVADNPFLPSTVRAEYLAAGVPTLFIGRQNTDEGRFIDEFDQSVARFSGGVRARFGENWTLNANGSYAEADTGERWVNAYSITRFFNAVDAVSVNGTPTCRVNAITKTDPSCSPANIFGSGNMSAAARSYFLGKIRKPLKTSQREFSLDLTGEPWSLWAGPLAIAAGANYREERARQFNDGVDAGFAFAGYPAFSGEVDVKEIYAQTLLTLARDLPAVESIETELAVRWVDYSQAGSELPWKLGLNWVPLSGVRVRVTTSEDIRAPNVLETNLPQFLSSISPQVNPLGDGIPVFNSLGFAPGQTLNVREIGGGNPALTPEIARTTSIGLELQPNGLAGFSASIDHYRIRVRDAITTLAASTIVQECAAGQAPQCQLIGISPDSTLPTVATISLNAQSFFTRGFDTELAYTFGIAGGDASIRALANYVLDYEQTVPRAPTQDLLGDLSYGLPKLQGDVSVLFVRGGTKALLSGTYIGSGFYRKSMSAEIENNHVPHVWYVGANVEHAPRRLCSSCTLYASVSNLLDRAPPHPGFGIYTNIDSNLLTGVPYDRVGRYFKFGLRIAL